MERHPAEVPVFIPRPAGARPGAPAPWEGRPLHGLDLATIRRRLPRLEPARGDGAAAGSGSGGEGVRRSAVLVPLFGEDEVWIAFGKRSAGLPSHRGDIAFPGGREHPADDDLASTALREAQEEMGIDPAAVEIIGELDHLGTMVSRFLIAPFVGVVEGDLGDLVPREGEFDRVVAVPLRRLLEPGVYHQEVWTGGAPASLARGPEDPSAGPAVWREGDVPIERAVNFFTVDAWDLIWGATATILRQFLDVITRP